MSSTRAYGESSESKASIGEVPAELPPRLPAPLVSLCKLEIHRLIGAEISAPSEFLATMSCRQVRSWLSKSRTSSLLSASPRTPRTNAELSARERAAHECEAKDVRRFNPRKARTVFVRLSKQVCFMALASGVCMIFGLSASRQTSDIYSRLVL